MPKLPDHVKDLATKHGLDSSKDIWDCHGTWVIYHRALEAAAARAGVEWLPPQMVETDSAKAVSMIATGKLGDRIEWSVGEASPKNNKNAYPWAMAEKRAKDRVILKLLGFAGEVYSEEEADDFKSRPPANEASRALPSGSVAPLDADGRSNRDLKATYNTLDRAMDNCSSMDALNAWSEAWGEELAEMPEEYRTSLRGKFARLRDGFKAVAA